MKELKVQSLISLCNKLFWIFWENKNMHDKKKDTKSFRDLLNGYFFDIIVKSRI